MNKSFYLIALTVVFLALFGRVAVAAPVTGSDWAGLTDYPRIEQFEGGSVQVDFPALDSWPDFRRLRAWLPLEVSIKGDDKPKVGSVYVQAQTDIDFEQRTVRLSEPEVLKTSFPDEVQADALNNLIEQAFQRNERIVPLDVLLRLLPEDFEIPGHTQSAPGLNFEPPAILVSETPLRLLSIDKEPVRAPLEGTGLEFVVNTDWYVFYHRQNERWYVLNEGTWLQSNFLSDGEWIVVDTLPADFDTLAQNDRWKEIQGSLPASAPETPPTPFVISMQATELILLDGAPRLGDIGDTGIQYVSNTQSDLFSYGEQWYFLVSGRWFRSNDLNGKWQSTRSLPDAFSHIPAGHEKEHVLYSVPGTRQARLAMIEAALPHRVTVGRNAAPKLEVTWIGEPRFEAIETTRLQRGVNTPYQVIRHNNFFYLCFEGAWYFSASASGPWKPALQIPDEIYRIPATDPAFNVTFVRLEAEQNETDDYVNYSYSSGYTGSFSTTISVVYGTGWYYPSSVFWGPGYRPYYWRYGPTYGYNFGYHPVGAYYGGRGGYYDPWGGWYGRTTVTLSSPTVDFTHGYGSAWEGPLQTTPGDPAKTGEKSLDEFLPKKKIDGTEEFTDTIKDGAAEPAKLSVSSLYMGGSLSSNRFSGPDGEVYKSEDQQWSQYNDGGWTTMQEIGQNYRAGPKSRQMRENQQYEQWLPAHKRTLSRSELDRQKLARLEGMDNYSKYRMEKESNR